MTGLDNFVRQNLQDVNNDLEKTSRYIPDLIGESFPNPVYHQLIGAKQAYTEILSYLAQKDRIIEEYLKPREVR